MRELYYQDSYLKNYRTVIELSFEEDGLNCVKLRDCLFYPQGGGQKGDRGILICENKEYNVINTIKDHYGSGVILITDELIPEEYCGKEVDCILDWEFRYKQMKLHTCVHLHHCMLEKILGQKLDPPKVSAIEEGFAFNKYPKDAFDATLIEKANKCFIEILKSDIPVITYADEEKEGYRWWECLGYRIPCGGVHVGNLHEIKEVDISASSKKGFLTIKFALK